MDLGIGIARKFDIVQDFTNSEKKGLPRSSIPTIPGYENCDVDLRLQAQEHMYRHTLVREKTKVSLHASEEVGRSITAISQRRRQYFLDYKTCNSIRQIRQWFTWEIKRNLDTNHAHDAKPENAAIRGLKGFLNKVEFYGTLVTRFGEYVVTTLNENYAIEKEENYDVSKIKEKMFAMQEKCVILLSDNHEISLETANFSEIEVKFPVVSILRQVHDTLCQMTDLATLWRIHARYAARYEEINERRSELASTQQLDEKQQVIKNLESRIRMGKYDILEVERDLRQREMTMASTEFCEVYNKCTDRIEELSDTAEEKNLEIKSLDTTIKYLHERTETFKKMVQHKRKEKLELNLRKREERLKELNGILTEISRLQDHKNMLDMKEEMWLRGGFEEDLGIIQDLKNKLDKLRKAVADLEQRKEMEKNMYHQTREQVLELDAGYERLEREYEYVRRLSASMLPILWKTNAFDQLPINSVKPNRVSHEKAMAEGAYIFTQPKGVAMIISNDERSLPSLPSNPPSAGGESNISSPHTYSASAQKVTKGTSSDRVPAVITCITALCAQLGFYIMPRHQLSREALNLTLASMSEQYHEFTSTLNSLLVIISSRSDEYGRPLGADRAKKPVSITKYMKHFAHSRCPSLIGKPKVFMFILRVTEHDPKAPAVGRSNEKSRKKKRLLSSSKSFSSNYFQPEQIDLSEYGDDILVIRVMYQVAGGVHAAPTFGGTNTTNMDKLPWHLQILIGTMMEQACYKDFLSVLEYIKEEVALGPKTRSSPGAKLDGEQDEVEIIIDHTLKMKLYLMPGL